MKSASELKQFCVNKLGMTKVRARTLPGKSKWQDVSVPMQPYTGGNTTKFDGAPFPENFRRLCLGVIYGEGSELAKQTSGGNVNSYSISMFHHEWETAIEQFSQLRQVDA